MSLFLHSFSNFSPSYGVSRKGSFIKPECSNPPVLQCNVGESPLFFGLQASPELPSMESLNIPNAIYTADRPNRFEPSISREKTLRLDLCYEEGTGKARLDKIVQKDAGYRSHANWLMAKIEGLDQLVFDQNVASLDIELELRKGNLPTLLVAV
ncbi:MAG: hypothetical protein AB7T49_21460 [Oligoflexales bacterium]